MEMPTCVLTGGPRFRVWFNCVRARCTYMKAVSFLLPHTGKSPSLLMPPFFSVLYTSPSLSVPAAIHVCSQVKTWGILWRPLEMRLERVSSVINAVVRLHNFLRRRRARVPRSPWRVTQPSEVRFRPDGGMEGSYFETVPTRGRPSRGATACAPREAIREYLEQMAVGRPRWNLQRKSGR